MDSWEPVQVVEVPASGGPVLRVSGETDLSTVAETSRTLLAAGASLPPPELVVLDLTHVKYLGAAGLRAVTSFAAASADRGVRTHLVNAEDGAVQRLLRITDLDERIPVFDTVEHALNPATDRTERSTVTGERIGTPVDS